MIESLGFASYITVPSPRDGFWRVSSWPQVFDPPQPPAPLGSPPEEDDGHRYDDPDGQFRTLYCATEAEGALGECLGDFVFNTAAVVRIEAFLESEPEPLAERNCCCGCCPACRVGSWAGDGLTLSLSVGLRA